MISPKIVWYIITFQNSQMYYLSDFDEDSKTALWCNHRKDAMIFDSKDEVTLFSVVFFYHRTDFHLLEAYGS